ncbi:MAG TPA: RNA polymerase factor sigma-32 [Polyangia bacterium]
MTRNLPVKADPVRAYLHQIGQFPILTPDEERELARRWYEERDVDAARRLVVSNLRFVVTIARQYQGYGLRPMDLIQEGNLGLMVAVKRFDPHRNIRLISYAVFWIRAYILAYVMRSWRLVRLGTTRAQRKLFYKIRQVQRQLRQVDPDADASPEAVGRALGVTADDVIDMDRLLGGRDLSLDAPAHGDGAEDDRPVVEVLPAEGLDPEQALTEGEGTALRRHRLQAALAGLQPRERAVLERRYLADEPASLADLGREQGLSRERMRQIEARALEKLRGALAQDAPDIIDVADAPAAEARAA